MSIRGLPSARLRRRAVETPPAPHRPSRSRDADGSRVHHPPGLGGRRHDQRGDDPASLVPPRRDTGEAGWTSRRTWPTLLAGEVQLRGAAAVGMEDVAYPNADGGPAIFPLAPSAYDGRCPKASALIPQPPLCEVQAPLSAFAAIDRARAVATTSRTCVLPGFNVVRLVLNWSQLEPTPCTYSAPLPQSCGASGGVGTPAGDLRDPRHAPGPVLALHRPGQRRALLRRAAPHPAAATARPPGRCRQTASRPAPCSASTS